jgi:hypothetical protein
MARKRTAFDDFDTSKLTPAQLEQYNRSKQALTTSNRNPVAGLTEQARLRNSPVKRFLGGLGGTIAKAGEQFAGDGDAGPVVGSMKQIPKLGITGLGRTLGRAVAGTGEDIKRGVQTVIDPQQVDPKSVPRGPIDLTTPLPSQDRSGILTQPTQPTQPVAQPAPNQINPTRFMGDLGRPASGVLGSKASGGTGGGASAAALARMGIFSTAQTPAQAELADRNKGRFTGTVGSRERAAEGIRSASATERRAGEAQQLGAAQIAGEVAGKQAGYSAAAEQARIKARGGIAEAGVRAVGEGASLKDVTDATKQFDIDNSGKIEADEQLANDRLTFIQRFDQIQKTNPSDPKIANLRARYEMAKQQHKEWLTKQKAS